MEDLNQLNARIEQKTPAQIMEVALQNYENIAIAFSGAEDVVLIDMATKYRLDVAVFCLDTGRLHPETYQFIEKVRVHYKLHIELLSPERSALQKLVLTKGLFSFYQDGHEECCAIRKVEPLRNKLNTLDAWITGQRKDQSQGTRAEIPAVQRDGAFSSRDHLLVKFNPLANWKSEEVWSYIKEHGVPYNELHDVGFKSIGCEPCTRPIQPGQQEREGRWWWEEATKKECGLHADNVKK